MYLYKLYKSEFFWYDLDKNHRMIYNKEMIYNKDEYAKQPDSQTSNYWPLICFKKVIKINSYLGWVDFVIDVTKLDPVYYWVIVTNIHKHGWKNFKIIFSQISGSSLIFVQNYNFFKVMQPIVFSIN